MRLQRRFAPLLALGLAVTAMGLQAPPAQAATDQLQTKAVSTYTPLPARHVVHVTIVMTMTNKAPSTTKSRKCTQYAFDPYYGYYSYTTTCTTRTDYYYNAYEFWVERDARAFKVKASSGTTSVKAAARKGDWRKVRVAFSPLNYGKTRTITLDYDLPAGGPRSTDERRVGMAYSSFCVAGPGTDVGTVRVRVPAGFDMRLTKPMPSTETASVRTYSSGAIKEPWTFYSCLTGTNDSAFTATSFTPTGSGPIEIQAWTDDEPWAIAVQTALQQDFPALIDVVGPDGVPAIASIHEDESSAAATDWFNPTTGALRLSEMVATRPEVTHRLARTLFDGLFAARWITEGYAGWAEHEAGVSDAPCTAPTTHPGTDDPFLARWVDLSRTPTPDGLALEAWQRQAACHIVDTLAETIGPDAMRSTLATIRDGGSAYPTTDAATAEVETVAAATTTTGPLDWRQWLDVVEVQGLAAAGTNGTDLTKLLLAYGVTSDAKGLAARAEALEAYHAMLALTDGVAPPAVTTPLADWSFEDATAAIGSATAAWTTAQSVGSTLDGTTIDDGPVQVAVTAATTQAELEAAAALANDQLTLAREVADAVALEAAPRDLVQEVGLIGTSLPAPEIGIAAVDSIDAASAAGFSAQVESTISAARDVGTQRLALGVGGILALILALAGAGFALRRRRQHRARAVPDIPASDP